jgi:hypothetical protein
MNVVAKSMVVALVSLLTGAAVSVATSDPSAETTTLRCEQRIYAAPDGRLAPHLLGRMPKTTEPVMGFEVVDGLPLVALPRSLLGFTDKGINEFAVPTLVKGLSVDHASHIELQTANGFETVGKSGVEPDKFLTGRIQGRLYGSGSPVFLEVRERQGMLEFVARQTGGRPFLIGGIKGTLRAASWNRIGLAAVVGNSLYVWQAGAKNVYRLVTDAGLAAARDVVLVGPNRAVVALKNNVILVTPETITVVMGMLLARCRFQDGVLYLMDGQSLWIWSFRGLDQLGTKNGDQAYATSLLKQIPPNANESNIKFQEAARILGCVTARAELAKLKGASGVH